MDLFSITDHRQLCQIGRQLSDVVQLLAKQQQQSVQIEADRPMDVLQVSRYNLKASVRQIANFLYGKLSFGNYMYFECVADCMYGLILILERAHNLSE